MQAPFSIIFSVLSGVMLVLASCVLVAPVLAVLVSIACVSLAWVLLQGEGRITARGCPELDDPSDSRAAGAGRRGP